MIAHPIDEQGLPLIFYKRLEDGETVAVLQKDMAYHTSRGLLIVPKGFESDGCSMPGLLWLLFGHPFDMQYLREAILHDWLYKEQQLDRKVADQIFREELQKSAHFFKDTIKMQILDENPTAEDWQLDKEYKRRLKEVKVLSDWKIACIHRGLRWGGWKAWNDHKKAKEKAA